MNKNPRCIRLKFSALPLWKRLTYLDPDGKTPSYKTMGARKMKRNGFALVVTLTLMILLTVIAVGLLSLSAISLRQSSESSAMATARANARMAMMLAIGELQKNAGPDQRVTATADIAAADASGNPIVDGATPANLANQGGVSNGLSAVLPGTRYWTGVWTNSSSTPADVYTKTPFPKLVQWLVSGNESNLTAGNPNFTPASANLALKATGQVIDPKTAVVLVGNSTVGTATGTNVDNYISVPLVGITRPSDAKTIGRYGWWVGDEGVKSKLNLTAPYAKGDTATYENLSAQRRGWETVNGFGAYPQPGAAAPNTPDRAITLRTVELMDPSFHTASSGSNLVQSAFHSATTDSYGVLADTLQGGLKLDLAAYLANPLPASNSAFSGMMNPPVAGTNIIPPSIAPNIKGPKWDRLQSFYTACVANSPSLATKPAVTDTDSAISPLIADLRILMGYLIVPTGMATDPAYPAQKDSFNPYPCAKVEITLANPYSRTLTWNQMELEISCDTPSQDPTQIGGNAGGHRAFLRNDNNNTPTAFHNAVFLIPAGSLLPGEARSYTHGKSTRPDKDMNRFTTQMFPFDPTTADDFTQCLIATNTTPFEDPWRDNKGTRDYYQGRKFTGALVDEPYGEGTSTASVELRYGQNLGTNVLRELVRCEFADPRPVTLGISNSQAAEDFALSSGWTGTYPAFTKCTKPIPLQLYSFQLSQPGVDYGTLMGTQNLLGVRSSTMRTFADFNLQATHFRKPLLCYNPPPYFLKTYNDQADFPYYKTGDATTPGVTGPRFTENLAISPLRWGRTVVGGTVSKTILFSRPNEFISLAQFQHADLTADDMYTSVAHQPGNALGNSYASPFVKRIDSIAHRQDRVDNGNQVQGNKDDPNSDIILDGNPKTRGFYDMSYLLNASLWDSYFFSTIPKTGDATHTPVNKQIVKSDPSDTSAELVDGLKASGHLLVNGAFNVNSVEKDAWKSLLASSKFLKMPNDSSSPKTDALYPRSIEQLGSSTPGETDGTLPSGTGEASFAGYRRLSDAQIDAVATEITRQVRARGPFVSLSQFVNRALVDLTVSPAKGRSGALQSALDEGGVNISIDGTKNVFTQLNAEIVTGSMSRSGDRMNLQMDKDRSNNTDATRPRADMVGDPTAPNSPMIYHKYTDAVDNTQDYNWPWPAYSYARNPGSVASIIADKPMLNDSKYRHEQGFCSTGIPGWLTQADLLQVIGPSITNRSDTFRIRTYGEAVDPSTGIATAKAWCEAIVQRVPDYLDSSATTGNVASDRGASLKGVNLPFGRQFKIISFHWLSSNDI